MSEAQHDLLITWTKTTDGFDLSASGIGSDRVIPGGAIRKGSDGKWRATPPLMPKRPGFTCDLLKVNGTARGAMKAINREMDRRSVGLFGVDAVNFEVAP